MKEKKKHRIIHIAYLVLGLTALAMCGLIGCAQSEGRDNAAEAEGKSSPAEDEKPAEDGSMTKAEAGENAGVNAEKTPEGDGLQEKDGNAGSEASDGTEGQGL